MPIEEKPVIRIHNTETGEVIDREMTDEEFANHKTQLAAFEAKEADERAKATAKADLLEKLGITEDEAKLLLS